jgi:hypothetical protein
MGAARITVNRKSKLSNNDIVSVAVYALGLSFT